MINFIEFQEPSSTTMTSMVIFNQHLLVTVVVIIVIVGWILTQSINFDSFYTKTSRKMNHAKNLEFTWTTIPAVVLLLLSVPSFSLIYALEESVAPDLTVKIIGHQWFWSYEFDDFLQLNKCELVKFKKKIKYTAYLLTVEGFPSLSADGYFRLLETTKKVLLPIKTLLRLLITSADVLHSWSVPSFGVKMDACPGRLNQVSLLVEKVGSYYGACYEICGIQHGFMPISIIATFRENVLKKFSS